MKTFSHAPLYKQKTLAILGGSLGRNAAEAAVCFRGKQQERSSGWMLTGRKSAVRWRAPSGETLERLKGQQGSDL
jgi:hypothetical protein